MKIDWTLVKKEHVKKACKIYDTEKGKGKAKNTFLLYNGKEYPAKHIRGLSFLVATSKKLDPSKDYSGGIETVKFFKKLGFKTKYFGTSNINEINQLIYNTSEVYASLQEVYRNWAKKIRTPKELKKWLKWPPAKICTRILYIHLI